MDTKFIKDLEKKAKDSLQVISSKQIGVAKPEKFGMEDLHKLIDEDMVKYGIKPEDSAVIIPKRADGGMYGVARYFDHNTIGPGIADDFKKGNQLVIPIEV